MGMVTICLAMVSTLESGASPKQFGLGLFPIGGEEEMGGLACLTVDGFLTFFLVALCPT